MTTPADFGLILILRDALAQTLVDRATEMKSVSVVTIQGRGGYTICHVRCPRATAAAIRARVPAPPDGMSIYAVRPDGKRVREQITAQEWQERRTALINVQPRQRDPESGALLPAETVIRLRHSWYGEAEPTEEEEPEQ